MPIRIPWDRFEVALLFQAYEKIANGADLNTEASKLSDTLRNYAIRRGIIIDDTYRNVNGMKMQLSNIQYLVTKGKRGLSSASPLIREMYRIYKYENVQYQAVLKEANRLIEKNTLVENAFFNYAKERTKLSTEQLAAYLQIATDFCHLKQPLLGMTNEKEIKIVLQKVYAGRLLSFKYGKDSKNIRYATGLYYTFIYTFLKSYQKSKEEPANQRTEEKDNTTVDIITNKAQPQSLPSLKEFNEFLLKERGLAVRSAGNYCTSLRVIERYINHNNLDCSILRATIDNIQSVVDFLMSRPDFVEINIRRHHMLGSAMTQYIDYLRNISDFHNNSIKNNSEKEPENTLLPDKRWQAILKEHFPDGYILGDFLCQLQASGFWEERYGEPSPLVGAAIDAAMEVLGTVRDGRVYEKSDTESVLFERICEEISEILDKYTTVYRSCIYNRYESELTNLSIYTEPVMTQQLLSYAKGRFFKTGSVFVRNVSDASLSEDCRKVLRNNGGAMSVDDISTELWFIPRETIYHNLIVDKETLNLDNGIWMLAEHFPLTADEAAKVGDMLDECFISQNFVRQMELVPLLRQHLPSIADNLSSFHFSAIFKILNYYLKDRFSFSKAMIAPKGAKQDFCDLFRSFAKEHDQFTLEDLSVFASDLNVPIYWENTYIGGAVRVSNNGFVNKNKITFDIQKTDSVLESLCTGDYLPFHEVSPSMMMHLPTCGYQWNGYLLLSYVLGFSKKFRAYYNSLSKTGYFGAMVKQSCKNIESYEDLVERILTEDNTWVTEDDALDLLVNRGIQAQKRFSGLKQIIDKARQNKLLDGR